MIKLCMLVVSFANSLSKANSNIKINKLQNSSNFKKPYFSIPGQSDFQRIKKYLQLQLLSYFIFSSLIVLFIEFDVYSEDSFWKKINSPFSIVWNKFTSDKWEFTKELLTYLIYLIIGSLISSSLSKFIINYLSRFIKKISILFIKFILFFILIISLTVVFQILFSLLFFDNQNLYLKAIYNPDANNIIKAFQIMLLIYIIINTYLISIVEMHTFKPIKKEETNYFVSEINISTDKVYY